MKQEPRVSANPAAIPAPSEAGFLYGGGEMGERIRRFDWSSTAIGAPSAWSHSLRAALQILLNCDFPMCIAWGADFVQIYNDAYRSVLGGKHPMALGSSAARTYADRWEALGAVFRQARKHGAAGAYTEGHPTADAVDEAAERSRTYACSALFDDDGGIGGVLLTLSGIQPPGQSALSNALELSETRAAQQRLELVLASMQDQFFMLDADWRYLFVNTRVVEVVDLPPEHIIGHSIWSLFPDLVSTDLEAELRAAVNDSRPRRFEFYHARLDRWFENAVYPFAGGISVFVTDITPRKRIEAALRESEERFAKAFKASPLVLTLSSLKTGKLLEVNETFERLSGYARAEVIGRTTVELGLWADLKDRDAEMEQVRRSGQVRNAEYRFRTRNGREMVGMLSAERIDVAGEACTLTVILDITERKQAEERLHESEQRFVRFMQHLPGLAWIKDMAGRYVFANESAGKAFGVAHEQLLGKTDAELFPAETAHRFQENDRQAAVSETGIQALETLTHPDGSLHYSIVSKFPIPGVDGRPALIGGMAVDVTEEKRKEEALRNSERLYRAIGESIDYGVWVCDPQGKNVYASESFLRLVGMTQEQCSSFGWGDVLHPDDAEDTIAAWKQCARSGSQWDREHRFRGVDGQWHSILARGVPVRNEQGEVTAWAGINLDIGRLKQIEDELREADRRKNEFLATLAHELRNPLAPIRTGLEIMRLAHDNRETSEKARAMMERQLQHLVRLIDDLMDLSRISRGKVELRKEPIDLATVVQSAVETSRPLIEQCRHELTVSTPSQPIVVQADLTRLAQVFANLLNNAAKYTDDGGRIALVIRRHGGEALISVKDNGLGIPAHKLPVVFEMFTQVDRPLAKSRGGLGIGLSIVKRLVEMHGGSVQVHSEGPGTGSEFVVRLPVRQLAAVPELAADEEAPRNAPTGFRVLIADDNADSAASLALMLKIKGNDVRTASDGVEAIEVAAVFRPQVVLLDIGMPRMNGYDACRRLREQAWAKDAMIVAMTGWGQLEDRRQSQEAGFDHHLVKPLDPGALEKLLATRKRGDA